MPLHLLWFYSIFDECLYNVGWGANPNTAHMLGLAPQPTHNMPKYLSRHCSHFAVEGGAEFMTK